MLASALKKSSCDDFFIFYFLILLLLISSNAVPNGEQNLLEIKKKNIKLKGRETERVSNTHSKRK